ncbi:hypothetical protein GA707_02650 [Nostocoides sp. F2B08]|uniref:hypothetical protein n=1 Tax=Nostocoides sp. F2B08 TaxID=2653936 RepID=UPI0012637DEE|nr:hypothetical protein [Tetrasphaera sp. F2B08]KAB7746416.1 hypothetical protein GA707_02650 [Tetrasphaera sp. F2B08]
MSTHLEDDVRQALRAGAESLSAAPDGYARVMTSVAVRRHRRRAVIAGTAIASLALAGVVGLATGAGFDEPRPTTPASERNREITRVADPASAWPARGALATDSTFTSQFEQALGADHQLLYAEDGEAGRVIIAISADGATVVYRGARGADIEDLERFAGLSAASQDITVAVPLSAGHLVIALMPEHERYAQISLPSVATDGSVYRNWRQIPVERGVARMVTADPVGALRVRTPVGDGAVHLIAGRFPEPGTLTCDTCDDSWVVQQGPSQFREVAAATVGVTTDAVTSRLLLDAVVPTAGGRIVSYVAELPTGGILRASYLIADLGNGDSTLWMVEPLRPLPVFDPARPFAFTAQPSGDLVIVAPGKGRIAFSPIGDVPALPDVQLTDGVGFVTELPSDFGSYRILAYASDGSLTGGWHGSALRVDDPLQVRYRVGSGAAG